jgi:hypothetical protein
MGTVSVVTISAMSVCSRSRSMAGRSRQLLQHFENGRR